MNKESFLQLINHPETISAQDIETLEDVVENFPYCQLAYLLIAKATHTQSTMLAPQKLRKAAAYAISRDALKKVVAGNQQHHYQALPSAQSLLSTETEVEHANRSTDEGLTEESNETSLIPISDQHSVETLTFDTPVIQSDQLLDELQTIVPTAPSSEDDRRLTERQRQLEIIENFIKAEPRISSLRVQEKNAFPDKDLAESSIATGTKIISENLAKILVKQGKVEKAIEMYKELICKYPLKKAYFADKIDELNSNT